MTIRVAGRGFRVPVCGNYCRFGAFDLNLETRALHTENRTVLRLRQPYKVLRLLLERDFLTAVDFDSTICKKKRL